MQRATKSKKMCPRSVTQKLNRPQNNLEHESLRIRNIQSCAYCQYTSYGGFQLQEYLFWVLRFAEYEKNQVSNFQHCTSAPGRPCQHYLMKLNSSLVVFATAGARKHRPFRLRRHCGLLSITIFNSHVLNQIHTA